MKRKTSQIVPMEAKTKRSSHRLSLRDVDEMIALYIGGMSARQVGIRYNVSIDNVRYHAQKRGMWPGGRRLEPIQDRFWRHVRKTESCWNWTGCRFPNGYGCFNIQGQSLGAHRVAYEFAHGAIPLTLQIDHLCGNKGCVRPDHLEVKTCLEHLRRHNKNRKRNTKGQLLPVN